MSDPLSALDLKFLPDWLKESAPANPYAGFQGDSQEDRRERSGRRPFPRDSRGEPRNRPDNRRSDGGPRNRDRDNRSRDGRPQRPQRPHPAGPRPPRPPQDSTPANVRVEFLPEPQGATNISKQIRQSGRAYALFATARLFLEKPERHLVRITSLDSDKPLFQVGTGQISFDRSLVERSAFRQFRETYYREEVLEVEPPKGNYTSVARCRSSGTLLGPTSYHGYQVAIRKLYEERFSRRMSFPEFQREEIELLTGEQAVADWKTSVSKQTVFHTTEESEPLQFKSLQEAEAHFRKTYLPGLVKSNMTLECSGKIARELPERALTSAIREAFDRELAYPAALVRGLRDFLSEQNLQVFKHRKRVLYLSAIRPKRAESTKGFSEGPASILKVVEEHPRISRRDLAIRILGQAEADSKEPSELKTQLAADLHYLVHAGFLIEFSDTRLDLPLSPHQINQSAQAAAATENLEESDSDSAADSDGAVSAESAEPVSGPLPEPPLAGELPEAAPVNSHDSGAPAAELVQDLPPPSAPLEEPITAEAPSASSGDVATDGGLAAPPQETCAPPTEETEPTPQAEAHPPHWETSGNPLPSNLQ
ncbi:MAG: hypothetical protein RLZZ244_2625 [Verrucomicrobiota bacterium]|jgi:hypothetical protein